MLGSDKPKGLRILVVEDEFLIALETVRAIELRGFEVIGPFAYLKAALTAAQNDDIDGALLDVNLRGELVFPVAAALTRRNIPFVFATSYDAGMIPSEFAGAPRYDKPVDPTELATAVARVIEEAAGAEQCALA